MRKVKMPGSGDKTLDEWVDGKVAQEWAKTAAGVPPTQTYRERAERMEAANKSASEELYSRADAITEANAQDGHPSGCGCISCR
ncbi:MAG: hypothetical protein INR62_05575 [Rhodospirillales bacterium]|nr:hypothetical protein [Acetobacter sp.]